MSDPIILRRRPITVEAMRVTEASIEAVAEWSGGRPAGRTGGVWIVTDCGDPALAHVGEWVVHGPAGFYPATDEAMWAGYEAVL